MKVLLDTNAYTALFRGHEGVASRVRRAEQVLVSVVVAGELLFGFRNGSRYEASMEELEDFIASPYVALLPVNGFAPRHSVDYALVAKPSCASHPGHSPLPRDEVL